MGLPQSGRITFDHFYQVQNVLSKIVTYVDDTRGGENTVDVVSDRICTFVLHENDHICATHYRIVVSDRSMKKFVTI